MRLSTNKVVGLSLFPAALVLAATASGCSQSNSAQLGTNTSALQGDAAIDRRDTFSVGVCGSGVINEDPDAGTVDACLTVGTRCSGTLIAPNLVLTARHCMGDYVYSANATGFCDATFPTPTVAKVTLGESVLSGTAHWRDVREQVFPAPAPATSTTGACDNDIALLILQDNVSAYEATPVYVDVNTDVAHHHPSRFTVVGRGVISDSLELDASSPLYGSEITTSGGLDRRILQNIPFVCATDSSAGCTEVDYSSPPSNMFTAPPSWLVIGFGPASGDSGAGYLDQFSYQIGAPVLLAVNSAGTFAANGDTNFSYGVRVSLHKDLLVATAKHAAQLGHYPLPEWAGGW